MPPDPWSRLRKFTPARIAQGRAGSSLPTAAWLAFAADHADARDAVYAELDVAGLVDAVTALGLETIQLRTAAADRTTYLQRPDLGRVLDASSADTVATVNQPVDVALIVADGLSATAINRHAVELLSHLLPLLRSQHLSLAPLAIVTQARVGVMDAIGEKLHARAAIILIGERPGLAVPDGIGAYLTFDPKVGNTDADRNCVSNIRPAGLPPAVAAETIMWLLTAALNRRLSGVMLKDERDRSMLPAVARELNG